MKAKIARIDQLPIPELQPLLEESLEQGFEFIDRMVTEFQNGKNKFSLPGESLFAVYSNTSLIAIGGLNRDPYLDQKDIGRVRHIYVLRSWRRQGIGSILMKKIIEQATKHYTILTLRTFSHSADIFYKKLGFQTEPRFKNTSHFLILNNGGQF